MKFLRVVLLGLSLLVGASGLGSLSPSYIQKKGDTYVFFNAVRVHSLNAKDYRKWKELEQKGEFDTLKASLSVYGYRTSVSFLGFCFSHIENLVAAGEVEEAKRFIAELYPSEKDKEKGSHIRLLTWLDILLGHFEEAKTLLIDLLEKEPKTLPIDLLEKDAKSKSRSCYLRSCYENSAENCRLWVCELKSSSKESGSLPKIGSGFSCVLDFLAKDLAQKLFERSEIRHPRPARKTRFERSEIRNPRPARKTRRENLQQKIRRLSGLPY